MYHTLYAPFKGASKSPQRAAPEVAALASLDGLADYLLARPGSLPRASKSPELRNLP